MDLDKGIRMHLTDLVDATCASLRMPMPVKSACGEDKFDEIMSEFNGVREYCNEIFKDISFAYGCVQYALNEQFVLRTIMKEKKAKKAVEAAGGDEV